MLYERDVAVMAIQILVRRADHKTRGGRTSARAKGTGYGTEHPNQPAPGQGGVDSRSATLIRGTDQNRIGTEQNEFPETPTGFEGRGHLHDSDGSKTLKTIFAVLGPSRGRTTRRILSRTWEPEEGWPQQEVDTVDTEKKDKLPREQPMASGQKRRWESGARQFLARAALQLGTTLAYDGGWHRIQQPWDVIELFSTDAHVSLAVSSTGGRATQPYDGGLGNSLRTLATREQKHTTSFFIF